MKKWMATLAIVWLLLGAAPVLAGEMGVFVSIVPQKFFVEKIGGSLVDVSVLVEPGASPHTYEPKPGQMAALSKASLYFAIGVNFEDVWLDRIQAANPALKIVHSEKGVEKIPMMAHHHHEDEATSEKDRDHEQVVDHDHEQKGLDPHIWTSPAEVKIIAGNIKEALVQVDPDNRAVYETNYQTFIKELDKVDQELKNVFAGREGMRFMVFHPAWGYLARDYGLVQIPVELEGKEPKPSQLRALIQEARDEDVKVIFVQPQFSTKSAQVIAKAIGGRVVFANPLAYDWLENLRKQAALFKEALR